MTAPDSHATRTWDDEIYDQDDRRDTRDSEYNDRRFWTYGPDWREDGAT